jgi:hypothetical protein
VVTDEQFKNQQNILNDHSEKIQILLTDTAVMKKQFENMDTQMADMKIDIGEFRKQLQELNVSQTANFNSVLQSNTNITQTLAKLAGDVSDNQAQESVQKNEKFIKVISVASSIITLLIIGFFAIKGINLTP